MSFIAEPTDFGFSSVFGNGQPPPGHGRPQGGQQQRRKLLEKIGKTCCLSGYLPESFTFRK